MNNERGSILVETILSLLLATLFVVGTMEIHQAWKKRFRQIIQHRNSEIQKIRAKKTEFLPTDGIFRSGGVDLFKFF